MAEAGRICAVKEKLFELYLKYVKESAKLYEGFFKKSQKPID